MNPSHQALPEDGFEVVFDVEADPNDAPHWFCGAPDELTDNVCGGCGRLLLRPLSLDLAAPELAELTAAPGLQHLERLPLVWCWPCELSELTYRMARTTICRLSRGRGFRKRRGWQPLSGARDFPYAGYPEVFPEAPHS